MPIITDKGFLPEDGKMSGIPLVRKRKAAVPVEPLMPVGIPDFDPDHPQKLTVTVDQWNAAVRFIIGLFPALAKYKGQASAIGAALILIGGIIGQLAPSVIPQPKPVRTEPEAKPVEVPKVPAKAVLSCSCVKDCRCEPVKECKCEPDKKLDDALEQLKRLGEQQERKKQSRNDPSPDKRLVARFIATIGYDDAGTIARSAPLKSADEAARWATEKLR